MNLVIDAGNTFVKGAVFDKSNIREAFMVPTEQIPAPDTWLKNYPVTDVIVSDVTGAAHEITRQLKDSFRVLEMSATVPLPIINRYNSPDTLGTDRIAAAVYGAHRFSKKNVLVIQAGTCITYDFVNAQSEYEGGSISPGLEMRFSALHTFTARLPLVKKQESIFLTGNDTRQSILSGVINGCIAEIDGIIDQYKQIFPDLMVVSGGGDIFFFDKRLKNRIFAIENLVLQGLNIILEFNKLNAQRNK